MLDILNLFVNTISGTTIQNSQRIVEAINDYNEGVIEILEYTKPFHKEMVVAYFVILTIYLLNKWYQKYQKTKLNYLNYYLMII